MFEPLPKAPVFMRIYYYRIFRYMIAISSIQNDQHNFLRSLREVLKMFRPVVQRKAAPKSQASAMYIGTVSSTLPILRMTSSYHLTMQKSVACPRIIGCGCHALRDRSEKFASRQVQGKPLLLTYSNIFTAFETGSFTIWIPTIPCKAPLLTSSAINTNTFVAAYRLYWLFHSSAFPEFVPLCSCSFAPP